MPSLTLGSILSKQPVRPPLQLLIGICTPPNGPNPGGMLPYETDEAVRLFREGYFDSPQVVQQWETEGYGDKSQFISKRAALKRYVGSLDDMQKTNGVYVPGKADPGSYTLSCGHSFRLTGAILDHYRRQVAHNKPINCMACGRRVDPNDLPIYERKHEVKRK